MAFYSNIWWKSKHFDSQNFRIANILVIKKGDFMTTFEIFDYDKQAWVDVEIPLEELEGCIIDSITVYEDDNDYRIRVDCKEKELTLR